MILLLSRLTQMPIARPIAGWAHHVTTAFHSFLRRKHTIAHLRKLDDRSLADVGIKRDEIETIVSEMEALVKAHNRRPNPPGVSNAPNWKPAAAR